MQAVVGRRGAPRLSPEGCQIRPRLTNGRPERPPHAARAHDVLQSGDPSLQDVHFDEQGTGDGGQAQRGAGIVRGLSGDGHAAHQALYGTGATLEVGSDVHPSLPLG
jgi:hypothetical protein